MRGWTLEPDHIIPRSRWNVLVGGPGVHDAPNLAAACVLCNRSKRNHVDGIDLLTGRVHRLFNPRADDRWEDHFRFNDDFLEIVPISPVGRATMARLRMNRQPYQDQRLLLRQAMQAGGLAWP
jgi:hypothetical protein